MKPNLSLLIVCCCCLALNAAGQSDILADKPILQRTVGSGGQDELFSATVNWRGDIATVGNAGKGSNGGQDILFANFDAQLNPILERHIGRRGEDGAGQIAALPDGRYLLVGYSTRPEGKGKVRNTYYGKRDGWVLVLDERGETERELILGTGLDDVFVGVAVCPDGSAWLAGNSGDWGWLVRLSATQEVLWERRLNYHNLPLRVAAATLAPDGAFFLTGSVRELNRNHCWVAGYDTDGKPLLETIFPNTQAEAGTGIAAPDATTLAIAGNIYDPAGRENGFLALIDRSGSQLHYQQHGGREFDRLNSLILLYNKRLLVGGGSASFERGSRRISALLKIIDDEGKTETERYYGSKLDDEVRALLEHPDGRIFAIGATAREVLRQRQGWIFQLSERSERRDSGGKLKAQLLQSAVSLTGKNRAFVPLRLENTGSKGQCNLRAELRSEHPDMAAYLRLPAARAVQFRPLPAHSSLEWGFPLRVSEQCPPGEYQVQVQYFQGENPIGDPWPLLVQVGGDKQPRLGIQVLSSDSTLMIGKAAALELEIRNSGTAAAQGVLLHISAAPGIETPDTIQLGALPAGAALQYRLPLKAQNTAIGSTVLQLRASDVSLEHSATQTARLHIVSNTPPPQKTNTDYTVAVWVYPNPDNFERETLVWPQEEITVQVKIVSNRPLTRQDFCLELNGQPCTTGVKFDEVQIKGEKNSKTFAQQVRLLDGENLLKAVVQTPAGPIYSEVLKIAYAPSKPNLHIVSIGIPSADLKFTSKDARDFALSLAGANNKAFNKIFLDTLLTEARTTKTEILKTLRRLQYRHADLQILPKDLLVLFISGHGLGAYDGSFRLAASDYDGPFLQETSLDFEQELINYLQSLPCDKLFLVDACHSGTVSGSGLAGIAARKNGLNILMSCRPDEYSYEDESWQNGAFTHALVQGIDAFSRQMPGLDSDADQHLEVRELFQYIEKEVPRLVEKKRPKVQGTQRPNIFLSGPKKLFLYHH
jgi:hypothetical protein